MTDDVDQVNRPPDDGRGDQATAEYLTPLLAAWQQERPLTYFSWRHPLQMDLTPVALDAGQ